MEKKNNILIIAIIILSILVVGLGGYIIFDKVLNNGTDVEETKKVNEDVTKDDSNKKYLGSYTLTYKDNAPEDIKGNAVSSLKLNEDGTFEFIANMCSGMLTINGNYSVNNEVIVLKDLQVHEDYKDMLELNLNGKTTLVFSIVSENEIYLLDSNVGCVVDSNVYGTFVK